MKVWKIAGLGVLALVVLGVVWILRVLWWAGHAQPGSSVDYASQLEAIAARAQENDTRPGDGYAALVKAVQEYQRVSGGFDERARAAAPGPPADWPKDHAWPTDLTLLTSAGVGEEHAAASRALLEDLIDSPVPELLDEVSRSRAGVRHYANRSVLVLEALDHLSGVRMLVRMNSARMRAAAAGGDWPELVRAFESSLALGRVMASQSTTIERLIGIACVSGACEELRRDLMASAPQAATLRELLGAMDRQLPLPALSLAIEAEHVTCLDTIQWSHSDDGRGDGYLLPDQLQRVSVLAGGGPPIPAPGGVFGKAVARVAMPSKKRTTERADRIFEVALAQAKLPSIKRNPGLLEEEIERLPRSQIMLNLMMPALGSMLKSGDRADVQTAGVRTMLGIELVHATTGAFPRDLSELVPSALAELPIDPRSGGPLVYVHPAPNATRPYLLYSIGADGKDNAGREHPQRPSLAVTGSSEGYGYDYDLTAEHAD